jgi:hypothetical protein
LRIGLFWRAWFLIQVTGARVEDRLGCFLAAFFLFRLTKQVSSKKNKRKMNPLAFIEDSLISLSKCT